VAVVAGGVGETPGGEADPEVVNVEDAEVGVREPVSVLLVHDRSSRNEASA
jgi:hypothetical protein